MASQPPAGGASFSLFPNANFSKPRPTTRHNQPARSRRSESAERRPSTSQQNHQELRAPSPLASSSNQESALFSSSPPPPSPLLNGRHTPLDRVHTPLGVESVVENAPMQVSIPPNQPTIASEQQLQDTQHQDALGLGYGQVSVQPPRLTIEVPGRTETAFSQAQTLVHSSSARSRSSIAKLPLPSDPSSSRQQESVRSIFPTYNPELPLDQQNYAPTQMSPSRIPRAVISRQSYYEDAQDTPDRPAAVNIARAPNRPRDPPVIPMTSTTDELRDLWKVTNGWKASGSEGRVYCLRLTQQKDAPVYTLSSATQPFYTFRLDPTSTSAYVSLSRHDPAKGFKASKAGSPSSTGSSPTGSGSKSMESKHWTEALSTTVEEESRKHRPNDGLISLLMPSAAVKVAVEKASDALSVSAAERECARLVWDDDSASHYLVHPALATPFCVTVEHCPAWSRVEYTLEHHESPQHLAKLTRDGIGGGWLEIDTGLASKIDAFYIVDIAVSALLLVVASEDRSAPASIVETFEAPPVPEVQKQARSISSRLSRHKDDDEGKKKDKKRPRMEQFEIDIESQNDSLQKANRKSDDDDKLPFVLRVFVKLIKGLFKVFIWLLTLVFGCFKGVFMLFYKCVGSKY